MTAVSLNLFPKLLRCSLLPKKRKAPVPLAQKLLRFQIIFDEQRRVKELCDADAKSLANFVDYTELYRTIGTVYQVSNSGFWHAAFDIQLIVGHVPLLQKLRYSFADRLIQQHPLHHTSL